MRCKCAFLRSDNEKKDFFPFALWLFGKFMKMYGNTFRYRVTGKEKLDELFKSGRSVVFFTWHNQIFPILHFHKGTNLAIIISSSKDGDIMAHVAESFGYKAVRGSSSRNGSKALLEIKKLMNGEWHAAIAVDGPKGPKYKMKPGALFLAKKHPQGDDARHIRLQKLQALRKLGRLHTPLPFRQNQCSLLRSRICFRGHIP
ncbi:MAG: DUF374 domain-containing protein [Geovibrio sp.]|nr:DUF374 domain-containing protein [Geovibrio sp.]